MISARRGTAFAVFLQTSILLGATGAIPGPGPIEATGAATAPSAPLTTEVSALLPAQPTSGILPDTRWRHVPPPGFQPESASIPEPAPVPTPAPSLPSAPPPAAESTTAPEAPALPAALVVSSAQATTSPEPVPQPAQAPAIPASAAPPSVKPGDYDITIPWGEPTFEAYRAGYLSEGGRKWLSAMVERGRPWMSIIMQKIYAYGLPEELAWLPIIESEFTANAVSRSGAVGMWQFMRNSVGGYGIRIDDWVDERRDFMKATDAALRKLADNYSTLGDWNLAIAAYNMGLGAISRAVAAGGTRDFFALRKAGLLSKETSAYVPKFLAVASILRHPARFGMELSWDPPVEWETVEPDRSVDLGLLAVASGVSVERLRTANAELKYAVTPPWKGYRLKVPDGAAAPIIAALDDPAKKLLRYTLHTVRSGDSVSAISRAYGAPVQLIVDANPGLQPSRIKIGQVLVIPVLKDGTPPPPPVPVDDAPPFTGSYSVAKGDSLWSLALRFGVRPETLAERNGLELASVLREGMSLSVPITQP
ncbi:MAG TPA: LysM peptidoglycan-binding domain-containing protein [Rectinemataceae bacterium]|nr:LysM peptidoglycan-binding domain-containing protein [Rectinemataceae bacterium]